MTSFHRSAFTLIELLVVITIIALLAAIMFPTFARARENARRASCSGNMKQIGLGLMQYIQDYDDFLPGRYQNGTATLQNTLQPYIKSYQIFQCPSNPQNIKPMNDDASGKSRISYRPNTRELTESVDNGGLFASNTSATDTPVHLASITVPSSTIALCEANGPSSRFSMTSTDSATMSKCKVASTDPDAPCLSAHHLKTSNYLFADGHVKALQPEKTLTPVNMWNRFDNAAYTGTDLSNAKLIVDQSAAYSR